mmetsp:Transcript_7735/g.8838  ORF Transcript_7735/g.8838 Transcript_7735/m.8838 type:complete len:94 (+) Transcript_7735:1030-1311(+)
MCVHVKQLLRSGPVIVTIRSAVAETSAATLTRVDPVEKDESDPPTSFGDSLTEDTPESSTNCFIFEPPFPMIIPQQGTGTRIRTTKENPGIIV